MISICIENHHTYAIIFCVYFFIYSYIIFLKFVQHNFLYIIVLYNSNYILIQCFLCKISLVLYFAILNSVMQNALQMDQTRALVNMAIHSLLLKSSYFQPLYLKFLAKIWRIHVQRIIFSRDIIKRWVFVCKKKLTLRVPVITISGWHIYQLKLQANVNYSTYNCGFPE